MKQDSAGLLRLPGPSLPWPPPCHGTPPGEAQMEAAGAEIRACHPPHMCLLGVQVQGFRAGPDLSSAWGDDSLPLIPAAVSWNLEFDPQGGSPL